MKKITTFVALLLTALTLSAQEVPQPTVDNSSDIRGRFDGAFEWELAKNLSLEAGVQLRLNNDFASVDRIQSSVGLGYKVNKHFNFGAEYSLINSHNFNKSAWEKPRHRLNANIEGSVKVGRVKLSLRERLQTTFRTDSVNRFEKPDPELVLRSRIVAEYDIRDSHWTPYLLFELNNTLNAPKAVGNYLQDAFDYDNYITRYRLGIGAKYRINKNNRLDFYYYFDYNRGYNIDYRGNGGELRGFVEENQMRHIFGISYKFQL